MRPNKEDSRGAGSGRVVGHGESQPSGPKVSEEVSSQSDSLRHGPGPAVCRPPAQVVIRASAPFTVFALEGAQPVSIYGPPLAAYRMYQFLSHSEELWVETEGYWEFEWTHRPEGEHLDPVPLEAALQLPRSTEQETMDVVRDFFEAERDAAQQESLEDWNNFEVPEEDPIASDYEVSDMDEDFPLENQADTVQNDVSDETTENGDDESGTARAARQDGDGQREPVSGGGPPDGDSQRAGIRGSNGSPG